MVGDNSKTRRPWALITGASSGIGYDFAKIFAEENHNLILVARSERPLKILAEELHKRWKTEAKIILKDLSQSTGPEEIYRNVEQMGIEVQALVNNAGFGLHGNFIKTALQDELDMIQVNIRALTHLTKLFIQPMVQRGRGKILNVASTAAFQAGPLMAVYYATKAYVLSFTEALASELEGTGVTATVLCPGPTVTNFSKRAQLEDSRLFKMRHVMGSARVAQIGYEGMMEGKSLVIPGLANKILAQSNRLAPRTWVTRAVRQINTGTS